MRLNICYIITRGSYSQKTDLLASFLVILHPLGQARYCCLVQVHFMSFQIQCNAGFVTVLLMLVGNTPGFGYWYSNSVLSAHLQLLGHVGPCANTRWTGQLMNCSIKLFLCAHPSKITSYSIEVSSKLHCWKTANLYWHLWTWNVTKKEKELKNNYLTLEKCHPQKRGNKHILLILHDFLPCCHPNSPLIRSSVESRRPPCLKFQPPITATMSSMVWWSWIVAEAWFCLLVIRRGPGWNCWDTWLKNHVFGDPFEIVFEFLVVPPEMMDVVSFTLAIACL